MTLFKRIGAFCSERFSISVLIILVFLITSGLIMSLQLFRHPIVGIADNSDFGRISAQLGIYPANPETKFKYANLTFPIGPSQQIEYASSEIAFCKLAAFMNRSFISNAYFDIRALGLTHVAAFLAALLLFAYSLKIPNIPKLIFLASCVFILVDVRITSYFNTFYSESASVIFLMFVLASMLLLSPARHSVFKPWMLFTVFLVFSFLLAFSKSQNLVMLIPLWGFGACYIWRLMQSGPARWCWILGTAILMFGGLLWGINSDAFKATKNINVLVVLIDEFKPNSPNFESDLEEMNGTEDDFSNITVGSIALFYIKNPDRYLNLLERRATKTFSHINYGNYVVVESREPYEQSTKFDVWWRFKQEHYPKQLWFVLGIPALGMFMGTWCFAKSRCWWVAHLGLITVTLAVMAICAFLIASTFEANGPEKHLFIFNVLFDLVTALGILLLYLWYRYGRT